MQNDETRRSTRVHKLFLTTYVNRDDKEQKTPVSVGRTLDISTTGVGMQLFQEVQPGSTMDLEFDLQGSLLTVKGRVVHVRREDEGSYIIGVEFDEPQKRLENLKAG
jgi:c-di-GMP-binding flagellar brake protein YcgR